MKDILGKLPIMDGMWAQSLKRENLQDKDGYSRMRSITPISHHGQGQRTTIHTNHKLEVWVKEESGSLASKTKK